MNRYRLRNVTPRCSAASFVLIQTICSVTVPCAPLATARLYRTAARRPAASPPRYAARSDGDAQAQLVEAPAHGVRRHTEEAGDGAQVLGADRDHAPVEVLALHLDHAQEATEQVTLGATHRIELGEIDCHLFVAVP